MALDASVFGVAFLTAAEYDISFLIVLYGSVVLFGYFEQPL